MKIHFVNRLSIREIAESCGDCEKTSDFARTCVVPFTIEQAAPAFKSGQPVFWKKQ